MVRGPFTEPYCSGNRPGLSAVCFGKDGETLVILVDGGTKETAVGGHQASEAGLADYKQRKRDELKKTKKQKK